MRNDELEQLRAEARYRRERLDLYRARRYGGGRGSNARLNELQRSADLAAERLRRAEADAGPTPPRA